MLICRLLVAQKLLIALLLREILRRRIILVRIVVVVARRLQKILLERRLLLIVVLRLLRVAKVRVANEILVIFLVALVLDAAGGRLFERLLLNVVHHVLVLLVLVRRVIGITLLLSLSHAALRVTRLGARQMQQRLLARCTEIFGRFLFIWVQVCRFSVGRFLRATVTLAAARVHKRVLDRLLLVGEFLSTTLFVIFVLLQY